MDLSAWEKWPWVRLWRGGRARSSDHQALKALVERLDYILWHWGSHERF